MSRLTTGALILAAVAALFLFGGESEVVRTLAAALPILAVLGLMIGLRWPGQIAGPFGWLIGLLAGALVYGMSFEVFWVSQGKGLMLTLFVLGIIWPALLLYHVVNQSGGIQAMARALEALILNRGLLLIVIAWAFSGMLEGLAGFGLPVAIVSPMLVGLGVRPVIAVAAVAVGHAWSITFGDMGVVFETLVGLVDVDEARLAANAGILLAIACVFTGLSTAHILGELKQGRAVLLLASVMGVTQYGLAVTRLAPLAAFGAGLAGVAGGIAISTWQGRRSATGNDRAPRLTPTPPLIGAVSSYGALAGVMALIALIPPLNDALREIVWSLSFPAVETGDGFAMAAGTGQVIRPLVHPGAAILLVALVSYALYRRRGLLPPGSWRTAGTATRRSATPVTIGVAAMVGLSTLMDHTGMTQELAETLANGLDRFFPVVSPLVGMLGAFATGSNNNSNVLFASLQDQVAILLGIAPTLLLATQTTGGALGSMIAPAKIIVGCSTVGLRDAEGAVLRITLPYGLALGFGMGVLALIVTVL